MNLIDYIHSDYIHIRRVEVLKKHLIRLIQESSTLLDVGAGDGLLDFVIMQKRPDIKIKSIDPVIRNKTYVPVSSFNGKSIPFDDSSFDIVMFIDILHHTEDPLALLKEAKRVASKSIIIKDHTQSGLFAKTTLSLMDKVGNEKHDIKITRNYWTEEKWFNAFTELELEVIFWDKKIGLYPFPLNLIFDRSLHFIAMLNK